jgi:hypothetical protein
MTASFGTSFYKYLKDSSPLPFQLLHVFFTDSTSLRNNKKVFKMQFTLLPCFFFLLNLPFLLAAPVSDANPPFAYEELTFIFAGGPASYTLTFPADGNTHPTSIAPSPSHLT